MGCRARLSAPGVTCLALMCVCVAALPFPISPLPSSVPRCQGGMRHSHAAGKALNSPTNLYHTISPHRFAPCRIAVLHALQGQTSPRDTLPEQSPTVSRTMSMVMAPQHRELTPKEIATLVTAAEDEVRGRVCWRARVVYHDPTPHHHCDCAQMCLIVFLPSPVPACRTKTRTSTMPFTKAATRYVKGRVVLVRLWVMGA